MDNLYSNFLNSVWSC